MRSGSPWRVCFYPDKCSSPCELANQPWHSPQWLRRLLHAVQG
ncbi:TPA: hypothetical protein ACKRDQ_003140 [Proteus mirabilis]